MVRVDALVVASAIRSGSPGARAFGVWRAGGFTNDQFRMYRNEVREGRLSPDPLQEDLCSRYAHLLKRLTNGGEARVVERGTLDVVESDD